MILSGLLFTKEKRRPCTASGKKLDPAGTAKPLLHCTSTEMSNYIKEPLIILV